MKVQFKNLADFEAAMKRGDFAGKAIHCTVLHDDWCPFKCGSPCSCKPEYLAETLTVDSFQRGAAAQKHWFNTGKN